MNCIYALEDPRTGEVRYIGQTIVSVASRLSAHSRLRDGTRKDKWIRALKNLNLRPRATILEEVEVRSDLNDCECFWIAQGRGIGWDLLNCAKGGSGIPDRSTYAKTRALTAEGQAHLAEMGRLAWSPMALEKRRLSQTGYKHNSESRAKIGAKVKAWHRTEKGQAQFAKTLGSPESRERQRLSVTGRKLSPETRAKLSVIAKARLLTPEGQAHFAKINQTAKSPASRAKHRLAMEVRAQDPEFLAERRTWAAYARAARLKKRHSKD